jgi:uncharacterized protein (DUF1697 family)
MKTCISMLRGINISGHKIIKMDALKVLYAELGFTHVQTYIQSGNVVFMHTSADLAELEKIIVDGIRQKFGCEVPVIVKEMEELKQIVASNPFLNDNKKDISKIYLTFLYSVPDMERFSKIGEGQNFEEEYKLTGNTIYIYCPNGYGNTKLSTNFLESKLKLSATSRNWKTILELLKIAEEISARAI